MRHILSLSGGKDSAALAVYMRDRVKAMEYIFSDTRKELPETYEYLERLEDYLGTPVNRLNAELGFDHWYDVYGGMLPSNHRRWCTKMLKLKPFEQFAGDDPVTNYVALRADENRTGYISHKPNITPVYPFQDDGSKAGGYREHLADLRRRSCRPTPLGDGPAPGVSSASISRESNGCVSRSGIPTSSRRRRPTSGPSRAAGTRLPGLHASRLRNSSDRNACAKSRKSTPNAKPRRTRAGRI